MISEKLKELKKYKKEHKKKWEEEKDHEKELYSKECVAHCINFVVGEAKDEVADLKIHDRFSCYLATILARDKEVVAVWLKILKDSSEIYLSKNFDWLNKDVKYINDITNYLKVISKNTPIKSTDTEKAFYLAVMSYCYTKFEFRWNKLKNDINNGDNEYVKSLKDYISAELGDSATPINISLVCYEYYKQIKAKVNSNISPKFLGHIKKVGSYFGSIKGIINCAKNIQYKPLFSNIKVNRGRPVIINKQPIYSWENIIKRFIDEDEDKYNHFMTRCSKKPEVIKRIHKVYTDNATKQLQLNNDNVEKCIYLHAEMHILASLIIDNKIKSRVFIAVSKKCCYLCELYINFAIKQGYNIVISGKHQKLYDRWILPHVKNSDFKDKSLIYILENLNQIIEKKIEHYIRSLPANFDNSGNNLDLYDNGNNIYMRYMEYIKDFDNVCKKIDLKFKI
ncbi:hypothetical protein RhiirA5_486094 [Rhizophagus irregularis]|uniref:Uncharacterized protein n=1 Tax=Rhizophagus irregularis TaxID=588596 RepID=A0A2N0PEF9_9GLOM|nr:hypothetical protein RhiirA5_486094 [Rhizophagus irregularis]